MKNKKFVTNENVSPQLFQNKWLDRLSRTHIAIPVTMFFLYAIGLIYYTKVATELTNLQVVALFFAGWFLFTFAEYMFHRFVYHIDLETEASKKFAYNVHGVHHDYPKDKQRLAMPPILSIVIGTILLLIFELILDNYSFSTLAGFMTGYAFYLLVHYSVHIFRPPNNILKELWKNHAIHHYKDDTIMYGVSSPIWDYVFRTLPKDKDMKRNLEVKGGV